MSPIIHYEQEHRQTCGIAAMRMILSSLGVSISEKEYMKLVTIHSYGIFSSELAIPFLKQGYKFTAFTFNLPILGEHNLALGSEIKLEHLAKGLVTHRTKACAQAIAKYISAGGKMYWNSPSVHLLKEQVKKGPLLVSVNLAALGDYWKHWEGGHYLVVTEVEDNRSFVYDPFVDESREKCYWIDNARLIPAITVNSIKSTDFCIVIEK